MSPIKKYFKWFIKWYKDYLMTTIIMLHAPNELSPEFMEQDDKTLSIEHLEQYKSDVDIDKVLKEMCEKADELQIKLYLDISSPRKKHIPEIIYFNNGFVPFNETYFVRLPK